MSDMAPDTWSHPEIVRTLQRIEARVESVGAELRSQRAEFVPREVWDEAWRALTEWKVDMARDVVDLQADAARARKERQEADEELRADLREELRAEREARVAGNRWAVTVAIGAASTLAAVIALTINALGLGVQ